MLEELCAEADTVTDTEAEDCESDCELDETAEAREELLLLDYTESSSENY